MGSFATALGALAGGSLVQLLMDSGVSSLGSYRVIVICYAVIGAVLGGLFTRLSPAVEIRTAANPSQSPSASKTLFGLHRSRRVVLKLSALFSIDAFAGGFVLQSILAYWFHVRFNVQPAVLGTIFFGANILCRSLGAERSVGGQQNRPDSDHGIHAHSIQYPAHPGAAHAEPAVGHCCLTAAF